jgi:hypothetical protein
LELNGFRCDSCLDEIDRDSFNQKGLPMGWVKISTQVGVGYHRDLLGRELHICPKCTPGFQITNGLGKVLLRSTDEVSPNWNSV